MDAAMARKYLSGEVSLDEASQPSTPDSTQTPSEVTSSNGDEDGKNPDDNQTQLETPAEPNGSEETRTATQSAEDHSDDTGTENPPKDDDKHNQTPKKDSKLPYPKATSHDVKEYKANKAFIKQKQKYQAKVAAMQSEINDLKAKLMKFNAVSEDSLADKPSELIDLKINKSTLANQIQNLEKFRNDAIEEQANAEAELIHQQRVEKCFTDETEANHYQTLLANGREKFVDFLVKYDPENTILQYLDDCEHSPLMVQVLMTNPEVLKRVVEIRNPLNKTIELRSLENKIMMERRLRKNVGKVPSATPAKKLPSTGSQVGTGAGSDKNAVRDSNYWRNYLQTH